MRFHPHIFLSIYIWTILYPAATAKIPLKYDFSRIFPHPPTPDPDVYRTTPNMVKSYGYPFEIHHVISDNYRLELHRIPRGITNCTRMLTPVLLHHGLATSSADFVLNPPTQSLAYLLADRGYDVWMGNLRGNCYSKHNDKISSDNQEFWDFSLDDIIDKDIPAVIDYILDSTNNTQLHYVGHSLGTTIGFGLLSTNTRYNDKIKSFIVLGPGVHLCKSRGILRGLLKLYTMDKNFINGELFAKECMISKLVLNIMQSPFAFLAEKFLELAFGDKPGTLDQARMPIYLSHIPNGIPIRFLYHIEQIIRKETFSKYDWGFERNAHMYSQNEPPGYNLTKVSAPTYIFYTYNDALTIEAAEITARQVGNLKGLYKVGSNDNGHLWFLLGTDAAIKYYNIIFQILET